LPLEACPVAWMAGHYGVSTHYFPYLPGDIDRIAAGLRAHELARQAADVGASWLLFTLHHQNLLLMAPNRTFAVLVGSDGYMSPRDVPGELIGQLQSRGVRALLYVNLMLRPEDFDSAPVTALGGWPPNDRLIDNLAAVYKEFSLRYGLGVSGWWVDGAGVAEYASAPQREEWFKKIAGALRAGNPRALVSFSPGLELARYSQQSDFTAGEANVLTYAVASPCVDGVQWHTWTYLGPWWGSDGERFDDLELCRYASKVMSQRGAMTFELGSWGVRQSGHRARVEYARRGGTLDESQLAQLSRLRGKIDISSGDLQKCEGLP
jgi:hypothetical protein